MSDYKTIRGRARHQTHFYEVRGLRLAWHEWGPADAPVVICIHGFLDHGRSYEPVADIVGAELRVIAPDIRGHGESAWVGVGGYYHFYDYYYDVRRLIAVLGNPEVLIVGHSMGGSVATGLASTLGTQVRGVIFLEGMGPSTSLTSDSPHRILRWMQSLEHPNLDGDVKERRRARRSMPSLEAAAERLARWNPRLPMARARLFAASFTERAEDGGYVWRYDPLHRTPSPKPFLFEETFALWQAISCPVLALYGGHGLVPNRWPERHDALQDALVGTFGDAGHNLHHERPEAIAEALLAFHRTGRPVLPQGAEPGWPGQRLE